MGLTVREALAMEGLNRAVLVAGHLGLDREISFVNIMEVPEVVRWMKGGELLLTSGYAFKDDPEERKELLYSLARKGIAAFGIKLGQHLKSIPQELIDVANEVHIPLLMLPENVPYMDYMLPILEALINSQVAQLKRYEKVHNHLLDVLLAGGGFDSLCRSLYELVDNPVLILDRAGICLASFTGTDVQENIMNEAMMKGFAGAHQYFLGFDPNRVHRIDLNLVDTVQSIVLEPVMVSERVDGFLVVIEYCRPLMDHDLRAIEYAGPVVALVFAKEQAVFDAQRQVEGEFLEELVTNSFNDEELMLKRGRFYGFNLKEPLVVFVIQFDGLETYLGGPCETDLQALKSFLLQRSHETFSDYPGGAMLQLKSNCIVGLVAVKGVQDEKLLRKKYKQIEGLAKKKQPKANISIGVGRAYTGVRNVVKSHEEALVALKVGQIVTDKNNTIFFQDLGPYRFLYELKGSNDMHAFYLETLGKIKCYDVQNQGNLIETLRVYFRNDGNLRRTAEEMFMHKNSIMYRIKKIEEITGLDLHNAEDRFNLQLGLKLDRIIE